MKKMITGVVMISSVALVGCTGQQVGTATGAAAGAGIGYAVSGGRGLGTVVGAGAGALIGNQIGRQSDRRRYWRDDYYYY